MGCSHPPSEEPSLFLFMGDKMEKKEIVANGEREVEVFEAGDIEEGKGVIQVVEQQVSLDRLGQLAEEAEKRVEYYNKIKGAILKLASPGDWVIFESRDEKGNVISKAELSWKGATRILSLFNIQLSSPQITKEISPEGHITFTYSGIVKGYGKELPIEGRASSKNKFWSVARGEARPVETIDMADVQSGAYHNYIKNAVKILLGLAGMDVEDLKKMGVPLAYARTVEFTPKEKENETEKYWIVFGKKEKFVKGKCLNCGVEGWVNAERGQCYQCLKKVEKGETKEQGKGVRWDDIGKNK